MPRCARNWLLGLMWLAGAAALGAGLGRHAVTRSQEARVLVTAREMLGQSWDRWLIPRTNGHVRLRKPPLAYWLTAASFALFGVGEFQGRLPAALAGWLTVGITFGAGRYLVGRRAGFLAAASLVSCLGFTHYTRLAETDPLVTLFVTGATYAAYRGYRACATRDAHEPNCPQPQRPTARPHPNLWFNISAVGMALALLTKGPPAAYPMLFLLVMAATDRNWNALRRWAWSGAPLTFLVVGTPWFAYILGHPEAYQVAADLRNSALTGGGHGGSFLRYVPQLMIGLLPWSGLAVLGVIVAALRFRTCAAARAVLVWLLAILVPLCLWANKQPHYLLPLLPPLMLLVGWLGDGLLTRTEDPALASWVTGVWRVTVAAVAVAAPAVILGARAQRGSTNAADFALGFGLVLAVSVALLGSVRFNSGPRMLATVLGLVCLPGLSYWRPTLAGSDTRSVAESIKSSFGPGPFLFYRAGENLPLCFYLGTVVSGATDEDDLRERLAADPQLVVLQARAADDPPDPPRFLHCAANFATPGRVVTVFVLSSQ